MRTIIFAFAAFICAVASQTSATEFTTATREQAATALTTDDAFLRALSPSDISVRISRASGTVDDLKALYAKSTLDWTSAESARLAAMVERNRARLDLVAKWLPEHVQFAKTSKDVDGGLPHTRGATIVWGPNLPEHDDELDEIFLHELFHVLSRNNPTLHDKIYGIIGFERCTRIDFPAGAREIMITNPDAPTVEHAMPTGKPGEMVTPVLFASPARYTPSQPQFPSYIDVRFVLLTRDPQGACAAFADAAGALAELDAKEAIRVMVPHMGRNTGYVFHPEELMADNFEQMMAGRSDAPDPWVYDKLAAILGIQRPTLTGSIPDHLGHGMAAKSRQQSEPLPPIPFQ